MLKTQLTELFCDGAERLLRERATTVLGEPSRTQLTAPAPMVQRI